MVDLPEFNTDTVDDAKTKARNLIPWLENPHTCEECGGYCIASRTFDPHMVEDTDSWYCGECDQHYRRDRV